MRKPRLLYLIVSREQLRNTILPSCKAAEYPHIFRAFTHGKAHKHGTRGIVGTRLDGTTAFLQYIFGKMRKT